MSLNERTSIKKLKGHANYLVWEVRAKAVLTKDGLFDAIIEPTAAIVTETANGKALATILLSVEDGPLHQIRTETRAKTAWEKLQNLYSPKGFASEFLLCKQFFDNTLSKHKSMEEYVNIVKVLRDDLENKGIKLPH